ncbi:MAG TPA: histidine phosphatase family protein [Rubrobacter sp.]|nr:histidine phosphatase family protein [Rubrobacter sp.]
MRHGQSTANAKGIWQGQMEFPLSERGRVQAGLAGRGLSGEPFEGVYSSPLSRAFETAEIIRDRARFAGEVVPVDGLSERHGGILEGHTWAEQEQRNPELAKKFLAIPEEERWALVGAETDEEVFARFEEALSSIRALHPGGSRIVVVSHGGVMRAFLRERFGPGVLPGAQRAANASITRLQWGERGPRLLEVASTAHLAEDPDSSTVE